MAKTDNEIRYRSPVYKVMAVPVDKVVANAYNPNVVAPPEMARIVDMGRRLHDAVCVLLHCRQGYLRTGRRLSPVYGDENVAPHI